MKLKILEVRDSATCIPVLAIQMLAESAVQAHYVHDRGGYSPDGSAVVLMKIESCEAQYDPCRWHNRTMLTAHRHIAARFCELSDGDVVDVEFILGESKVEKRSERLERRY